MGIRPGEKMHEQMISIEDAATTFEYDDYYKILPIINGWSHDERRIKNGVKVAADFIYDSSSNDDWMSVDTLIAWLNNNQTKLNGF